MRSHLYAAVMVMAGMLSTFPAAAQRYEDMHGAWHSNFGWGHMLFGGLMMVLVLGVLIGLIFSVIRGLGGTDTAPPGEGRERDRTAVDFLDERYARGEIDREEYQQRRQDLTR